MNEKPIPEDVLDKIVLLLVSGLGRASIEEAAGKLGLEGDQKATAIAEAKTRIQIAARWERSEQLGIALVRQNDIYRRALAVQDAKTALAVQKELNRLLDLYRSTDATPAKISVDRPSPDSATSAEIAAARAYLTPLGLGNEKTPLSELCRMAVLRIIEIEDGGQRTVSQAPRTRSRDPEGPGTRRARHRSNPAD